MKRPTSNPPTPKASAWQALTCLAGSRRGDLKEKLEELNALPLACVRFENNALFGGPISGGRLGIEHLQWITTPKRPGDDALNVAARNRWRRLRPGCLFALNRCCVSLGGAISNRGRHNQDAENQ
jgi:hypothetical protein